MLCKHSLTTAQNFNNKDRGYIFYTSYYKGVLSCGTSINYYFGGLTLSFTYCK